MKTTQIEVSAICMTCGQRDDHTGEGGLCQNNEHDNWLEEKDVTEKNMFFLEFAKKCKLKPEELHNLFFNPKVKQIKIKK
jgi:hypothetical protein